MGSVISQYLEEISKYPLLTREEERYLGERKQRGDTKALESLINSNLRYVVRIAKKYKFDDDEFLNIIQEGNIGLMKAAEKFKPQNGKRFLTYANYRIRQAIGLYLKMKKVPKGARKNKLMETIDRIHDSFYKKNGYYPSVEEITEHLNMGFGDKYPVEKVERAVKLSRLQIDSLNEKIFPDEPKEHIDNVEFDVFEDSDVPVEDKIMDKIHSEQISKRLDEYLAELSEDLEETIKIRYKILDEKIRKKYNVTEEKLEEMEKKMKNKKKERSLTTLEVTSSIVGKTHGKNKKIIRKNTKVTRERARQREEDALRALRQTVPKDPVFECYNS